MTSTTTVQDIVSNADSDGGKLILMYLSEVKQAAVREIAETLDLTLAKTYSVMKQLKQRGVVKRVEGTTYTLAL